jgi:hypothetical protein
VIGELVESERWDRRSKLGGARLLKTGSFIREFRQHKSPGGFGRKTRRAVVYRWATARRALWSNNGVRLSISAAPLQRSVFREPLPTNHFSLFELCCAVAQIRVPDGDIRIDRRLLHLFVGTNAAGGPDDESGG